MHCGVTRAVETEKLAWIAERSGRGGSMIKELCPLQMWPRLLSLLAKDRSTLISDEDKLQQRSEHFSSVVNYSSVVSESILNALPAVAPGSGAGCPAPVDNDAMCIGQESVTSAYREVFKISLLKL